MNEGMRLNDLIDLVYHRYGIHLHVCDLSPHAVLELLDEGTTVDDICSLVPGYAHQWIRDTADRVAGAWTENSE